MLILVVSILLSLFICITDRKQSEFSNIVTNYVLEIIMCHEQKLSLLHSTFYCCDEGNVIDINFLCVLVL